MAAMVESAIAANMGASKAVQTCWRAFMRQPGYGGCGGRHMSGARRRSAGSVLKPEPPAALVGHSEWNDPLAPALLLQQQEANMRNQILAAAVVLTALAFPAASMADETGLVGGAVAGAVVGGPVGAVVGAVVGNSVTDHRYHHRYYTQYHHYHNDYRD